MRQLFVEYCNGLTVAQNDNTFSGRALTSRDRYHSSTSLAEGSGSLSALRRYGTARDSVDRTYKRLTHRYNGTSYSPTVGMTNTVKWTAPKSVVKTIAETTATTRLRAITIITEMTTKTVALDVPSTKISKTITVKTMPESYERQKIVEVSNTIMKPAFSTAATIQLNRPSETSFTHQPAAPLIVITPPSPPGSDDDENDFKAAADALLPASNRRLDTLTVAGHPDDDLEDEANGEDSEDGNELITDQEEDEYESEWEAEMPAIVHRNSVQIFASEGPDDELCRIVPRAIELTPAAALSTSLISTTTESSDFDFELPSFTPHNGDAYTQPGRVSLSDALPPPVFTASVSYDDVDGVWTLDDEAEDEEDDEALGNCVDESVDCTLTLVEQVTMHDSADEDEKSTDEESTDEEYSEEDEDDEYTLSEYDEDDAETASTEQESVKEESLMTDSLRAESSEQMDVDSHAHDKIKLTVMVQRPPSTSSLAEKSDPSENYSEDEVSASREPDLVSEDQAACDISEAKTSESPGNSVEILIDNQGQDRDNKLIDDQPAGECLIEKEAALVHVGEALEKLGKELEPREPERADKSELLGMRPCRDFARKAVARGVRSPSLVEQPSIRPISPAELIPVSTVVAGCSSKATAEDKSAARKSTLNMSVDERRRAEKVEKEKSKQKARRFGTVSAMTELFRAQENAVTAEALTYKKSIKLSIDEPLRPRRYFAPIVRPDDEFEKQMEELRAEIKSKETRMRDEYRTLSQGIHAGKDDAKLRAMAETHRVRLGNASQAFSVAANEKQRWREARQADQEKEKVKTEKRSNATTVALVPAELKTRRTIRRARKSDSIETADSAESSKIVAKLTSPTTVKVGYRHGSRRKTEEMMYFSDVIGERKMSTEDSTSDDQKVSKKHHRHPLRRRNPYTRSQHDVDQLLGWSNYNTFEKMDSFFCDERRMVKSSAEPKHAKTIGYRKVWISELRDIDKLYKSAELRDIRLSAES